MRRVFGSLICAGLFGLMSAYAAAQTIDLSSGGADLILHGPRAGSHGGFWLDQGALSDGDDRRDLVSGAPGDASSPGQVFVIFAGPVRQGTASLNVADTIITGPGAGDGFGTSTAIGNILTPEGSSPTAIAIGAPGAFGGAGAVYLFAGGFPNGTTLTAADATAVIVGKSGDQLGTMLASGDLNGDGYREIIIGAPGNNRVYVIDGGPGLSGTINLSTTAPASTITGAGIGSVLAAGNLFHSCVSVAGIDGLHCVYDLLLGAPSANSQAGAVYLLKGHTDGSFPSSISVPSGADAVFTGIDPSDLAGSSVHIADIDGDGWKEIVVGAPGGDGRAGDRPESGEVYVLWGSSSGFSSMSLASASVIFYGANVNDRVGVSITAGGVNRDIPNDLVMRAGGGPNSVGLLDVYYGRPFNQIGTAIPGGQRIVDFATSGQTDRTILGDQNAGEVISVLVWEDTGEGARDIVVGAPYAGNVGDQLSGNMYVTISPRLNLSTSALVLDGGTGNAAAGSFNVSDASPLAVTWTAAGTSWLTVSPTSGTADENHTIPVTVNTPSTLGSGTHTGTVTVTSTSRDLDMFLTLPVTLYTVDNPTISANVTFPTQAGTPMTFTAGADAGGLSLEYKFWRYKAGSGWTVGQNYSTSNAYTWTPSAADTGQYEIQVWIRRQGSTADLNTWASTETFAVNGPVPHITAIAASAASPVAPGTAITWTATTTGGLAPLEFKCWLQAPSGTWTMIRDWAASNTCTWTTSASTLGSYNFQVWVRNSGGADLNDWKGMTVTVASGTPSVSLTINPASHVTAGSPVTVTAMGTGGSAGPLQYKFWRYSMSAGTWTMVQDYSGTNTYTWTPARSDTGQYVFQVWVRSAGSSASYETWAASNAYSVSYTAVTVTSFTASRPSPITTGTAITLTAQATGGTGHLEYEFWRYSQSAGWGIVQPYSASNTLTWTPGAGAAATYQFQVWVRSVGSSDWEAYGSLGLVVQ